MACAGNVVARATTDDEAALRWSIAHHDSVIDQVFGEPISEDELPLDLVRVVTVRVRAAGDEAPEVQVSLRQYRNGQAEAEVIRLDSPLITQLTALRKKHHDLSTSETARKVRASRVTLTGQAYPAVLEAAAAFDRLTLRLAFVNGMVLDPRRYQVWVDAGGERASLNLLGRSDGRSPHPLIRWIEDELLKLPMPGSGRDVSPNDVCPREP